MYTDLQQSIIYRTTAILKDVWWFSNLCLDNLPKTDEEIAAIGEENLITRLIADTESIFNPELFCA